MKKKLSKKERIERGHVKANGKEWHQSKPWSLESDERYANGIGNKIISLRLERGLTEFECAVELGITPNLIKIYSKQFKPFRKQLGIAKRYAFLWWKSEYGRRALIKDCDSRAVENYLIMEFGYKIGQLDEKEDFGFDISVRPK